MTTPTRVTERVEREHDWTERGSPPTSDMAGFLLFAVCLFRDGKVGMKKEGSGFCRIFVVLSFDQKRRRKKVSGKGRESGEFFLLFVCSSFLFGILRKEPISIRK
ncbi:unnamed protein product [Linum trigynum]|uniref:Uncharacterized protein n=1 Tax=Linum trigynum TaxID=586398 RepID=A0AAV2DBA5_9ROSI